MISRSLTDPGLKTAVCIWALFNSPLTATPAKAAKYRTINHTVGRAQKHWGVADDNLRYTAKFANGKKVQGSVKVEPKVVTCRMC